MSDFLPVGYQPLKAFADEFKDARDKLHNGEYEAISFHSDVGSTPIPANDWATKKADHWLRTGIHNTAPNLDGGTNAAFGFRIFVKQKIETKALIQEKNKGGRPTVHAWARMAGYLTFEIAENGYPEKDTILSSKIRMWFDKNTKNAPGDKEIREFVKGFSDERNRQQKP